MLFAPKSADNHSRKPTAFETFEIIFGAGVFIVLALALSLFLASSAPAVGLNMKLSHSSSELSLQGELHANALRSLAYVRGATALETLQTPLEGGMTYTQDELAHLSDVRTLLVPVLWALFPLSVLTFIFLLRGFFGSKAYVLSRVLKTAAWSLSIFLLLTLVIGMFSFDFLFTQFHHLLFPQGNWMFPLDSLLIQTFPLQFWSNAAIMVLIGIVGTTMMYFFAVVPLKR